MSLQTIEQIEIAIEALPSADRERLMTRLNDSYFDEFEAQVAKDCEAGLLDSLIEEALNDVAQGRARPL